MILVHHPEVELSRDLLAAKPEGVAVIDWSQPEQVAGYTGPAPSAFPSVAVDVPGYSHEVPVLGQDGEFQGMTRVAVPDCQEALRLPANWAAVDAFVAFVTNRAAQNPPE